MKDSVKRRRNSTIKHSNLTQNQTRSNVWIMVQIKCVQCINYVMLRKRVPVFADFYVFHGHFGARVNFWRPAKKVGHQFPLYIFGFLKIQRKNHFRGQTLNSHQIQSFEARKKTFYIWAAYIFMIDCMSSVKSANLVLHKSSDVIYVLQTIWSEKFFLVLHE